MFSVAETTETGVRHSGAHPTVPPGVRIQRTGASFELVRDHPGTVPVYYRVGHGRLEWGTSLTDCLGDGCLEDGCLEDDHPDGGHLGDGHLGDGAAPAPDPGYLLTLIRGGIPAPDSTPVPGVQRLSVGTAVRVDSAGVTVSRRRPAAPPAVGGLARAVGACLSSSEFALAYSGGLASAFVAASALRAGRRPLLLHADLGPAFQPTPPAAIPGLETVHKPVDPFELLDYHPSTDEPLPPVPDAEVPRRMLARLGEHSGAVPLVSGGLLRMLTSVKLQDVAAGLRGWRLLGCQPFHICGTLRTLAEARALLGRGVVHSPDVQPVGAPPPPSPTGGAGLPGLTATGRQALETAHRGSMALWQEHLDSLEPALGRLTAGLAELGDGGATLPALDPGVLAAVAATAPERLGRIRRGMLRTHLPLRRVLAAHGIDRVDESAPGFWLRLAAAGYLHRERAKITAELERGCALADLGLIEPAVITGVLRDGRLLTDLALPLLRMVWIDRWLRGRS